MLHLNSDPEVVKYVHEAPLTTEVQARTIINEVIIPQYKKNLGRWAMYKKENGEFIGWCGLKYLPKQDEIDLGYRLLKKEWGNGYATEAAKATLDYGFKELKLSTIVGKAHVDNTASLNVLEKIGMQYQHEEIEDGCPIKVYSLTM